MAHDGKYIISEFYTLGMDNKVLIEAIEKNIPLFLSGIFQKANTLNRNGRVYPYEILRREATKYMELVESNMATGELNHPAEAIIDLERVCHKVVDMWWQGESLYGKLQVAETPMGDVVKGLLKTEITLGISSRGVGSVKTIKGEDIVQDDFELIAFDIVSTPSTPGSYLYQESVKIPLTPITEEKWQEIKCKNGVCRIVSKEKTILKPTECNINEQCKKYKHLYNLSNNDFWKKIN